MQREVCVCERAHTHGDTQINALRDIDANAHTERDIYRGTHRYMDTDSPTNIHNTCTQRHVYIMNNCVTSVAMLSSRQAVNPNELFLELLSSGTLIHQ